MTFSGDPTFYHPIIVLKKLLVLSSGVSLYPCENSLIILVKTLAIVSDFSLLGALFLSD